MEKTYVTTEEFNTLLRKIEVLSQNITQATQSGGQLGTTKSSLGTEDVTHDVDSDESFKADNINLARLWNFNNKLVAASELSERVKTHDYDLALKEIQLATAKLELARKEQTLLHDRKLNSLELREAENAALIKHIANAAVVEAQFPVRDDESKSGKKDK